MRLEPAAKLKMPRAIDECSSYARAS
jgi:hypothetical protein